MHAAHIHKYYRWKGWVAEQNYNPMGAFFYREWARKEQEKMIDTLDEALNVRLLESHYKLRPQDTELDNEGLAKVHGAVKRLADHIRVVKIMDGEKLLCNMVCFSLGLRESWEVQELFKNSSHKDYWLSMRDTAINVMRSQSVESMAESRHN